MKRGKVMSAKHSDDTCYYNDRVHTVRTEVWEGNSAMSGQETWKHMNYFKLFYLIT